MLGNARRLFSIAVVLIAAVYATPSNANQSDPSRGDIADYLFFDFCLGLLDGDETISGNQSLIDLGFPEKAETKAHPLHGEISAVEIGTDEEGIMLGGAPEIICLIGITGDDRIEMRDRLLDGLPSIGLNFEKTDDVESPSPLLSIDTFKASLEDGVYLKTSFMTVDQSVPNPSVFATIYFTAE